MKKLFTRQAIAGSIRSCGKRFPATICFVAALTLYLIFLTWTDTTGISERLRFVIGYYLSVGSVLSLTLRLWGEEMRGKRAVRITQGITHAILVADTFYLYFMPEEKVGMETYLAHASVLTALGLAIFIMPFFRERDDMASWNFTARMICNGITTTLIGLLMMGGLSLLTASLTALFGIVVESEVYVTLWILCNCLLSTLLFLGLVPDGDKKHDRMAYTSTFLNKIIRFLLLPLLGCYLAVLYGYTVKVLVEMQLPDGWISKLVVTLMFGCLCAEAGFYPSIKQDGRPFEKAVARWLPVVILPMLVLMSIAIARRISDYGITVSRLYILSLNIWFYIVCIGLYLGRARRIHWIPVSFAALFLLVSALPVNFVSLTKSCVRKEIQAILTETYKGKLPLGNEEYREWLGTLPYEKAERVGSLLSYLDYTLEDPETKQWVDKKGFGFSYYPARGQKNGTDYDSRCRNDEIFPIPQGYTAMRNFWHNADSPYIRKDTLMFTFPVDDSTRRNVRIALSTLKERDAEENMEPLVVFTDNDYQIVLESFHLEQLPGKKKRPWNCNISFNCSGYLFMKK